MWNLMDFKIIPTSTNFISHWFDSTMGSNSCSTDLGTAPGDSGLKSIRALVNFPCTSRVQTPTTYRIYTYQYLASLAFSIIGKGLVCAVSECMVMALAVWFYQWGSTIKSTSLPKVSTCPDMTFNAART